MSLNDKFPICILIYHISKLCAKWVNPIYKFQRENIYHLVKY